MRFIQVDETSAFRTISLSTDFMNTNMLKIIDTRVMYSLPYPLSYSSNSLSVLAAKGFSSEQPKKRVKSSGQVDREVKAAKYDEISKAGGQEYRIYVRKFGSDDKSWFPAGAIAVPRGAQVSDAIFSNEAGIKQSIVKMYPKLKGQEEEFEFGYNLKIYPDDPVEVAVKGSKVSSGPASSVVNWVTNLLSPVDTSGVNKQ